MLPYYPFYIIMYLFIFFLTSYWTTKTDISTHHQCLQSFPYVGLVSISTFMSVFSLFGIIISNSPLHFATILWLQFFKITPIFDINAIFDIICVGFCVGFPVIRYVEVMGYPPLLRSPPRQENRFVKPTPSLFLFGLNKLFSFLFLTGLNKDNMYAVKLARSSVLRFRLCNQKNAKAGA